MKSHKRILLLASVSFIAGVLWLSAVRFVLYNPSVTHYHANFAVFIDGQRLDFDNPLLYEEVQSCNDSNSSNPRTRVHMHDQIGHVVHVHDEGATWGHFFANIGMTNGDTVFRYGARVFNETNTQQIRFMLNGEEVDTTANRVIESEDILLVSIGVMTDQDLTSQYAQIEKNAGEYNSRQDPGGCSGSADLSIIERFKQAVIF